MDFGASFIYVGLVTKGCTQFTIKGKGANIRHAVLNKTTYNQLYNINLHVDECYFPKSAEILVTLDSHLIPL